MTTRRLDDYPLGEGLERLGGWERLKTDDGGYYQVELPYLVAVRRHRTVARLGAEQREGVWRTECFLMIGSSMIGQMWGGY
jgi:hypothetical protein